MLNWDDPLAKFNEPAFKPQRNEQYPHAGDGLVSNEALMNTAGDAPVVDPVPPATEDITVANIAVSTPVETYHNDDVEADLTGTGLEDIEMGAELLIVNAFHLHLLV